MILVLPQRGWKLRRLVFLHGDSHRRAGTFLERVDGIDGQVFKAFDQAAGPADLDPIDLGGGPEAEVDAHVAAGEVAGAAAHFVDERARTGFQSDLRADAVAAGGKGGRGSSGGKGSGVERGKRRGLSWRGRFLALS